MKSIIPITVMFAFDTVSEHKQHVYVNEIYHEIVSSLRLKMHQSFDVLTGISLSR